MNTNVHVCVCVFVFVRDLCACQAAEMLDNKDECRAACASAAVGHQRGGVDQHLLALTGIHIFSPIFYQSAAHNVFRWLPLFCNFNRIDAELKNWQLLIKLESCHELAFLLLLLCIDAACLLTPLHLTYLGRQGSILVLSLYMPDTLLIAPFHLQVSRQVFTCSGGRATEGAGPYVSLNPLNNRSQQPLL